LDQRDDVLFLLVGGKPEQVRALQEQTEQMGLADHFQFTGNRPPAEIPLFIRLSEVLLSPRVSGTNTPLKIYSYLQSGKPIVATNLYTHTQVLNPDVSVLVEPNSDALARGIIGVLEDPQAAAGLGARARQLFESAYGYQTYLQKTDQILQLAAYGNYTPSDYSQSRDGQRRIASK
jgi:glycosyltransferase involved in cell wall biosynthesis